MSDLAAKRADLQKKINAANEKRRVYIADAQKTNAQTNTLDQAILSSVKEEAKKQGFTIE